LEVFKKSEIYQRALAESPAAASSLAAHFGDPRAEEAVVRLEKIPVDSPSHTRAEWRAIKVPTLVMACGMDAIHPYSFGVTLAREIPGAEFKELTSKSVSLELYEQETQRFLEDFLLRHYV
jgi:pimeloyl-ACP methyl ester carboxylesterase